MTRLLVSFGVLLLLLGCDKQPAELAIADTIEKIEQGLEAKSSRAVSSHLSESFTIDQRINKKGARGMLAGYFQRYKTIELVLTNIEVTVNKNDPLRASSSATAALLGANNLFPERAQVYQLKAQWQLQGSDWLLVELSWQ